MCFRITESAIEFQDFGITGFVDHQSSVQEAGISDAFILHAEHRGADNLAHDFGMQGRRHDRRRRIGAHAAGVRAAVAIEQAFVVLAGGERQDMIAVDHDNEAGFFADQKFFDQDARAGGAELVVGEHEIDRAMGFVQRHGDNHAFPCR